MLKKKIFILISVVILFGLSWLAWWLIAPIFNVVEINDALPEPIAATALSESDGSVDKIEPLPSGVENLDPTEKAELEKLMAENNAIERAPLSEPMPALPSDQTTEITSETTQVTNTRTATTTTTTIDTDSSTAANTQSTNPPSTPVTPALAQVMGTIGHPATGTVRAIETVDGTIVRFEDFSTIDGPRLHVYLATDLQANDFIDLGPIRGTTGNINYTIPEGTDLDKYRYVLHWCVPFGVLFNHADLAAN